MRQFERVRETPDVRLTILVMGVSSTSTHDFNRLVGIVSNAHVMVGEARIIFLPPLR